MADQKRYTLQPTHEDIVPLRERYGFNGARKKALDHNIQTLIDKLQKEKLTDTEEKLLSLIEALFHGRS